MKNLALKTITGVAALLLSLPALAQIDKGASIINVGVGYSLFSSPSSASFASSTESSIPVISATYDYAIVDHFSYGIGLSYQQFTQTQTYYNNGANTNYTQNIYVTNAGIRALYHFGSPMLEGYTGIRMGYSFWTSNQPTVQQGYYGPTNYNKNVPSFMAILGMRASLSDAIAVHLEIGLGSPYAAETGISFKFGGMPSNPKPPSAPAQPAQQF